MFLLLERELHLAIIEIFDLLINNSIKSGITFFIVPPHRYNMKICMHTTQRPKPNSTDIQFPIEIFTSFPINASDVFGGFLSLCVSVCVHIPFDNESYVTIAIGTWNTPFIEHISSLLSMHTCRYDYRSSLFIVEMLFLCLIFTG